MSFTGDLEHLSIVDVVQLLHATRKSGTLQVSGTKGVAQLVFRDGFIVSASHFDERLRIGAILVEAGVLGREDLERALAGQRDAGERRRPLIATLIEEGRVGREDAYRALETLIELTIVDILTWKTGSFTLDVDAAVIADDYRYFPERLNQELHFHAENVLMEALRIYDEKKRDRRPDAGDQPAPPAASPAAPAAPAAEEDFSDVIPLGDEEEVALSADDLGLADVEGLERRIPGVFAPIEDRSATPRQAELLRIVAPGLAQEDRDAIAAFLDGLPRHPAALAAAAPPAVILLGADPLLAHCLTTVCLHAGFAVLTTTDPADVAPFAEQHRLRGSVPLLLVDRAGLARAGLPFAPPPQLGTIELDGPPAEDAPPAALRTVLAAPRLDGPPGTAGPACVSFLEGAPAVLQRHLAGQASFAAAAALRCVGRLREATEPQGVARAVITSVTELGARAFALLVRGEDLVAARALGLHLPGGGLLPLPELRVPLAQAPLLGRAVETLRCQVAPEADPALRTPLFAAIGAPADPLAILVPIAASGRAAAVVCADFGSAAPLPPPVDLLETFAAQAAAALEGIVRHRRPAPSP